MNKKSGRVSRRLGHFSKTDIRFWQDRLFRETYRKNGQLHETSHWSARIQYEGRRERFPLYTPNKAAAAARARDIYLFLLANGWEPALAKYRKPKAILHEHSGDQPITVGIFLEAVFGVSTNRATIEGYATAFRKIVADLFGFSGDPAKFDHRSGRAQWFAKVHAIELSKITPARIQEWKQSFLVAAWSDPLALRKARISVNTFLRRFRQYHAKAKGPFVIPSRKPPKVVSRGDYYRCESHFDTLNAWLRGKGVNTQKPLHTLRKEYGSLINKAHGIHAASKALRHADISVTNNFYTDSRARVTPRFGKLFATKTRGRTK